MRSTRSGEVILGKKGGWREESFISLVLPFKNNKIKSVCYFYNPIFYLKKVLQGSALSLSAKS